MNIDVAGLMNLTFSGGARTNRNKKDIEEAISYINEERASKAWLFFKEKETLCFGSYEFRHLVIFFYYFVCLFQTFKFIFSQEVLNGIEAGITYISGHTNFNLPIGI